MKKFLALALAATLVCQCLNAQETPPATPPEGAPQTHATERPAPPKEGEQGKGGRRQITPEQIQERQTRRFREIAAELKEMYDANKDGVIDPQERAKLDADVETARKLQHAMMLIPVINEVDADRNLEISDDEIAKIPEVMMKLRPQMGPGGMPGGPNGGRRGGNNGQRGQRPNGPRSNRQGPPPQGNTPAGEEPPAPPAED